MESHAIVIDGFTKTYGKHTAVNDLSIEVPRGSIFGLLGQNGAGKSTTIKTLLNLLQPTSGRLSVLGLDSIGDSVALRRKVGYLPEEPAYYAWMRVDEIVRFNAAFYPTWDTALADSLIKQLDLPRDKHVFLSAGLLSRRKDPVTVIKGFLMSKVAENCILVLLGDGPLRKRCSDMAGPNGNVRVVGFVDNVGEYMRAADTFVSASLTEGCPNVVMEAMACGLPVVLSDISPHREILEYDGRAGLMFATNDTASLSKAFAKSLEMDCSQQRLAALSIINNHLNAENMSSKYQELYAQLHE